MNLSAGWMNLIKSEFEKQYISILQDFLKEEYSNNLIYPNQEDILRSFYLLSPDKVRVVILGQDPYHGVGQANGLAFAVKEGVSIPPSLQNIFKEIKSTYGKVPNSTALEGWAEQGVLLLNSVLTVRDGCPNSHKNKGWEIFTDKIIEILGDKDQPMVFMLWGNAARNKRALIKNKNHLILEAPHPSPLSAHRGFLGCNHFLKANEFLKDKIDWTNSRSFRNAY